MKSRLTPVFLLLGLFTLGLFGIAASDLAAWVVGDPPVALFEPPKGSDFQTPSAKISAPALISVKELTPEQAASATMYRQLNADIVSGRRAATKSGVVERPLVRGVDWDVIEGGTPPPASVPTTPVPVGTQPSPLPVEAEKAAATYDPPPHRHYYSGGSGGGYSRPPRTVEVPEPSTWWLILTGVGVLVGVRLHRRNGKT